MTTSATVGTADKPLYPTDAPGIFFNGEATAEQLDDIDLKYVVGTLEHKFQMFKMCVRDEKGQELEDAVEFQVFRKMNAFKMQEILVAIKKRWDAGKA